MGNFLEVGRTEWEDWIESVCESIRRRIRLKRECGTFQYDTRAVYRVRASGETEPLSEENLRKYCSTRWMFWCEADFSRNDFAYDAHEDVFRFGKTDLLFDFLKEAERRLAAEGIVPVAFRQTERRVLGRVYCRRQAVRTSLHLEESLRVLREADAAYAEGKGKERATAAVASTFACFIDEN